MIPPFFLISPFAWLEWLFGLPPPAVSPAGAQDAEHLAVLHAAAFRRGWSAEEFERLLIERNVVAHFEGGHAGAEFDDFTGRLMADDGRHPGKGAVGAEFP